MNDRELLLRAILKQPDDLTARLVYADWLDDHPELPGAAATAEFIRVACRGTKTNRGVPRMTYPWFRENWKRLLPSTLALSIPRDEPSRLPEGVPWIEAKGLKLDLSIVLPGQVRSWSDDFQGWQIKLYPCRLRLYFGGGLAYWWKMGSEWGRKQVEPALRADRPELFLGDGGGQSSTLATPGAPDGFLAEDQL